MKKLGQKLLKEKTEYVCEGGFSILNLRAYQHFLAFAISKFL
jgi:hypothetical protein